MSNKITFSKTIFFCCSSFILGVFFAPISIFLGFFLIFFFYFFLRNPLSTTFCFLFFLLGAINFHYASYNTPEIINIPVTGRVIEEPTQTNNFTRIKIENNDDGTRALLYTEKYTNYSYGDVLLINGKFSIPEDEGYLNYLKKDGVYYVSFYPEIEKIGEDVNPLYQTMYLLRRQLKKNIQRALPSPQNYLAEAMILGDRSSFSEDFNRKLSISGTRHITAISGMHIIIISTMLFLFFSLIKINKRWSAVLSLIFVALFIVFVGAPASAVRAGIMGSLLLLTHIVYRRTRSLRIVVFAGATMLAFNPLLLHYDLGFQLSFLAVTGILIFHKPVKKIIVKNSKKYLKNNERIIDIIAVTISAQILVTPLILYNFGHISLLSIPANVLIVPFLQYIMPFIFLTAVTGFFVFSFITYLLLSFVILVIDIFSKASFSAIYIETVPLYIIVIVYIYIFYRARNLIYI